MRKKRKTTSKHIRRFGYTLKELAKIFNVTESTICRWVKDTEITAWMERSLEEKKEEEK